MRRVRRRYTGGQNYGEHHPLIASWMIRLLLEYKWAFKAFYTEKNGYGDSDIAEFLLLPDYEAMKKQPSVKKMKSMLDNRLIAFEKKITTSTILFRNVQLLSQRMDLSKVDRLLLVFSALVENSSVWDDLFRLITIDSEQQFFQILACMLDQPVPSIKGALSKKGFLRQSGMIALDKSSYEDGKLGLMDSLEEALFAENDGADALIAYFMVQSKPATLHLDDYPHAKQDIDVIKSLVGESASGGDAGVNILIYGTPGTGKTELARLLSAELNLRLFEVKTEDGDGDPIKATFRLASYRLSQHLLARDSRSLILFDEVEDIFPAREFSFFGLEVKSGDNKGWMNKMLEENTTPAIWVCNKISQIDPAFLRRFDYVMELDTPPKSVRMKIVQSYLGDQAVSGEFLDRLAEHAQLSPAQISKIGKIAARISGTKEPIEPVLEQVIDNSLKAMDLKPLPKNRPAATHYDLQFLNTDADVVRLVDGLQRRKCGNICFYGAPGTGKTALAAYIAKQLDRPLLSKRASDILSMWVGESEKNIARMFEEAKKEEAVLVLDEADSLLRDRRGANRSWEVTQVNELLVQMENFDGLFICSTNLMDDLDQAGLRRFAIKIEFDYLKPDQAFNVLQQECISSPIPSDSRAIAMLPNLAPGDFAAVKKRLHILGQDATPEVMIRELKTEVKIKAQNHAGSIGFL